MTFSVCNYIFCILTYFVYTHTQAHIYAYTHTQSFTHSDNRINQHLFILEDFFLKETLKLCHFLKTFCSLHYFFFQNEMELYTCCIFFYDCSPPPPPFPAVTSNTGEGTGKKEQNKH